MFQVENAELVGPKALLFLQLFIAFLPRSAVNVPMVSSWFPSSLLGSLLKKYVCSCLDDENEIPLKVIALFSASRFALP